MNFSIKFFLVLAVAVLMIVFLSCSSDDDNGTNSTVKLPGNNYDVSYLMMSGEMYDFNRANVYRIQDLLDMYQAVAALKSPNFVFSPDQVPTYHASSQYWYHESADTSSYGIEKSYDSVQFLHSGVPVQTPDSALLTEIKGGANWILIDTATAKSSNMIAPGDTHLVVNVTFDIVGEPGEIAGTGDVFISFTGSFDGIGPSKSSDCDWNCDFTSSGDSLAVNITDDNCPSSGVINFAGTMVMICPSQLPSYNNSWTATETFNNGNVAWHFENEAKFWNATGNCAWYLDY